MFLPHPRVKVSIVGSLRDREVACSASDRQGSNFESCVWRTVSFQSSHHPQEVLLAQFSLYVHKGGLKPDSFHFPVSAVWKEKKVSSPSTYESQYCGEPPWPRSSVLGLRPPGLEFRILCLEDSVSSHSSHHPQEVLLAQFSLNVHKGGLKPDSFHLIDDKLYDLTNLNNLFYNRVSFHFYHLMVIIATMPNYHYNYDSYWCYHNLFHQTLCILIIFSLI